MAKLHAKQRLDKVNKLDLAAEVSARIEIEEIRLIDTVARYSPSYQLPNQLKTAFRVSTSFDESKSLIAVSPHFQLIGTFQNVPENEEPLRIEASFLLTYSLRSGPELTKENFDAFGELNGLYNAYPFWREYVQSTTARMGLPVLTIPVLKPARLTDSKSSGSRSSRTASLPRKTIGKRS